MFDDLLEVLSISITVVFVGAYFIHMHLWGNNS